MMLAMAGTNAADKGYESYDYLHERLERMFELSKLSLQRRSWRWPICLGLVAIS
jgi:hypothetical protein